MTNGYVARSYGAEGRLCDGVWRDRTTNNFLATTVMFESRQRVRYTVQAVGGVEGQRVAVAGWDGYDWVAPQSGATTAFHLNGAHVESPSVPSAVASAP